MISIEIKNNIDRSTIALLQCNGRLTTGGNCCHLVKIYLDKVAIVVRLYEISVKDGKQCRAEK